jgi:hypothetical protein
VLDVVGSPLGGVDAAAVLVQRFAVVIGDGPGTFHFRCCRGLLR